MCPIHDGNRVQDALSESRDDWNMKNPMKKSEILEWSHKYDEQHPWWVKKEKELGDRLREKGELTKEDLIEIVEWKFKTTPRRLKINLGRVRKNEDDVIRNISSSVLRLPSKYDYNKIERLCRIKGVGSATASVILTFYDPKNYGVFDIHVWREPFGKDSRPLYNPRDCLILLSELRELAKKHSLDVRVVEKALFKKNLDRDEPIHRKPRPR